MLVLADSRLGIESISQLQVQSHQQSCWMVIIYILLEASSEHMSLY